MDVENLDVGPTWPDEPKGKKRGRPKKEITYNPSQSQEDNPIDKLNKDDFLRSLAEARREALPKMRIALVRPGAIFQKANEFAAGYDVKVFDISFDGKYIKYMLGIKSELPHGWYAKVHHRSSNSKYDVLLANAEGIIDEDFRGEWQARFKVVPQPHELVKELFPDEIYSVNNGDGSLRSLVKLYKEGEIALQVTFHKIPDHQVVFVNESELTETQRGEGGFGSTSK